MNAFERPSLPTRLRDWRLMARTTRLVLSIHWLGEGLEGGMIRGCPVDVEQGQ